MTATNSSNNYMVMVKDKPDPLQQKFVRTPFDQAYFISTHFNQAGEGVTEESYPAWVLAERRALDALTPKVREILEIEGGELVRDCAHYGEAREGLEEPSDFIRRWIYISVPAKQLLKKSGIWASSARRIDLQLFTISQDEPLVISLMPRLRSASRQAFRPET